MNKQLFDQITADMQLKNRAFAAANDILCRGLTPTEAGKRIGISRQAASKAAQRVRYNLKNKAELPKDWAPETLMLSPELKALVSVLHQKECSRVGVKCHAKIQTLKGITMEQGIDLAEIVREWRKTIVEK